VATGGDPALPADVAQGPGGWHHAADGPQIGSQHPPVDPLAAARSDPWSSA